ncbi:hypothetical protein H2198_003552 [Neophaeococcomyces mojaviensis]|uniref:Uncharacterized protein n=1 Tax=Neophaeococcomyces mojaviensis TaxID=3383035 RepID=A0ACC3AB13_9EURO|nr:hypothetical protein H2198_003552 [Knufia sp. JES_112]
MFRSFDRRPPVDPRKMSSDGHDHNDHNDQPPITHLESQHVRPTTDDARPTTPVCQQFQTHETPKTNWMGGQLSGNDLGHGYEQFEQLVSLPSDINQFPKDESAFNGIDDGSSMQDIQAPYYSDFRNPFHEAYQSGVALTERAIQQGKIRREEAYQNKKPYYRKDGGKFITGQARKCYFEWPQFFINDYEVAHLFFGGQFIPQNKGGRRRKDQKPHAPSIWSVQPQDTARPSVTSLTGSTNPMHMSSTPPIFASHPPHSSTQTSTLSFSAEELSLFGRVPSAAAGQDNGSALQALRNTNTARAPWFNANNRIYRNPRPAQTTSLPHETNTGTLPSQSFDSSAQDHNDVLMDLMDNNINRPNHSIAGNPDQSEQEHQAPTTTILSAANEDEWDKFVRATFPVHSPEILSAQEWWTAISEQASKQTPPQQAPPNASPIGNAEADHTTTPVQTQTTDNLTIPDADLAFYRGDMYGD